MKWAFLAAVVVAGMVAVDTKKKHKLNFLQIIRQESARFVEESTILTRFRLLGGERTALFFYARWCSLTLLRR